MIKHWSGTMFVCMCCGMFGISWVGNPVFEYHCFAKEEWTCWLWVISMSPWSLQQLEQMVFRFEGYWVIYHRQQQQQKNSYFRAIAFHGRFCQACLFLAMYLQFLSPRAFTSLSTYLPIAIYASFSSAFWFGIKNSILQYWSIQTTWPAFSFSTLQNPCLYRTYNS